ncbi:PA14 domain-containing protein [Flavobacterium eburneipallidum]|uniref:PA14 domain-containing protein n=1 Tax=Flavobacterium eburneipallidum TaxID=3003263 RepID=UPI0024830EF1|nr:PA14 domain-containing protein [Flavobacterium eburneipallidum]
MNNFYSNSIKNTSTTLRSIGFLMLVLMVNIANAADFTSNNSGNWNNPAIWTITSGTDGDGIPDAGDNVIIANGNTVTVNIAALCTTLTINNGNAASGVTISGTNSLTVSGAVSILAGSGTGDHKILNVAAGSLTAASISMAPTGNDNRYSRLSISTGTVNVFGSITMNDGDVDRNQVTFSGSGTLNVGGTITGGALTSATGTVNYNNAGAQNIGNYTYNNLTLSGSGTKTFTTAVTTTNNFSIATTAIANLGSGLTHSAGILTLGGEGTVSGSWGSTTSGATNQTNTYFSGTGRVNNSCTAPTISTQPAALTICENSGGTFSVATSATSPTYQWQYSSDNINWINTDASLAPYVSGYTTATLSLSNTPLSYSGNYVRCIVWSSTGCRTNSNSVQLTVSPALSAPTVGTITQPTCSTATASVVLNGLPTGSWVLTRNPGSVTTTGNGTSTTISGLAAGSTYTYSVNGLSNGLKGEYYNNMNLTGSPALTRTDATVNFDWGNGSPEASIPNDGYSVRWTGQVQPVTTGVHTFSTNSDDGIRLWVNGVQIIDNWTNHAPTVNTGNITLTAGVKYNIVLEYYESSGGAVAQLSWSYPSQPLQIIPTTRLFPIGSCASPASANIVIDPQPSGPTAPIVGTITQPNCSIATGSVVLNGLPTGSWILTRTPGSVTTLGTGTSTTISALTPNTYTYSVNGLTNGLKGEYYTNMNLTGSPALTRTDATAGFNWGGGSPDPSIPNDGFSVRWSGYVQPLYSETYTFSTSSDDGIRLWVNGVQIINNWTNHGVTVDNGNITLTAGVKYSIVLEFFENGGDAIAQLSWSSPSQASQIIPQSQLYSMDTCGASASSSNIVINSPVTNTWNGAAWSTGAVPSSSEAIVFNGNYPPAIDPNVDITGCSCTVNTGRNVTINSGRTLTITNSVTVSGSGTLTFEDTASLVQINDAAVNSGNIIYRRSTAQVISSDYTYWSSPVANQTLNISPSYASGLYYSYDDFATPENWKQESLATTMAVGKGYIMRGTLSPTPSPPTFFAATFTGVPNNGAKTLAIGPSGVSVLLGNPYPSALDAETFLDYNAAVLEGTIYFWTHKTAIQAASNLPAGTAGSGIYAYTSNDYAAYNALGGVTVGSGSPSASGSLTPSGKIAAGQSFFATSTATGSSVVFNNSMRVAANNTQFFRTKNDTKNKTTAREKHRIWLDVSNKEGAFKQTLIGYITDATNNYEDRFDGVTFDGNEFIDFYSINQDKNLVIQGRALPFDENDEVPLGFKTAITGAFTININHADGLLTNQSVFLEDKLTNTVSNLKTGNYTFNTTAGTFNDRFVLKFTNKTLGTGEFDDTKNQVVVSLKNKQIKINSFAETIAKVAIYDLSGKLIYQKLNVNANELVLIDFTTKEQVLIVKTTLEHGTIVNDKVVY